MADKEYYSFEEALKDLELEEDELKRLVSAGEIRAFRDKQTMRFKAADIERLKTGDGGGDDLDMDLDLDLDLDDGGGELELADEDDALELDDGGGDDDLVLEEIDLGGGDEAVETEELDLGGDDDDVEELDLAAAPSGGRRSGGGSSDAGLRTKRKVGAEARAAQAAESEGSDSVATLALLTISGVVLLLATFTVFSAVAGHSNPTNSWIVNLFGS